MAVYKGHYLKRDTRRFWIGISVAMVAGIITAIAIAYFTINASPQTPERGVGESRQPSTKSTTQKATTTPTTKPTNPYDDIHLPTPLGDMKSVGDHL